MSTDILRREARLIILRFLAEQTNRTLTSTALTAQANAMFLIGKERAWIEQELDYLATMGAVRLTTGGSVKIATLTPHGARHLNWDVIIPEVMRPSERIPLPEAEGG